MKRRINLLSITFTKRKLTEVIGDVRAKALIVLVIFVVLAIAEGVTYYYLNNQLTKFNNSKLTLEQYLQSNKEADQKIKYFIFKYGLLNKYLKEDANSYFYYTKIQDLIKGTAPTGQIKSFTYNNTGETTFSVSFPTYEEASVLIATLETPEFLDNFDFVRLQGFDAVTKENQKEFVVNIEAKIIQEDEH